MKISDLESAYTVDGWRFLKAIDDSGDVMFEARGSVFYDDEHDEMPDPSLWGAARKLTEKFRDCGISAFREYSEKGWVEVVVIN